jgi:hypothetical protein
MQEVQLADKLQLEQYCAIDVQGMQLELLDAR